MSMQPFLPWGFIQGDSLILCLQKFVNGVELALVFLNIDMDYQPLIINFCVVLTMQCLDQTTYIWCLYFYFTQIAFMSVTIINLELKMQNV